jgi:hypothetical protein
MSRVNITDGKSFKYAGNKDFEYVKKGDFFYKRKIGESGYYKVSGEQANKLSNYYNNKFGFNPSKNSDSLANTQKKVVSAGLTKKELPLETILKQEEDRNIDISAFSYDKYGNAVQPITGYLIDKNDKNYDIRKSIVMVDGKPVKPTGKVDVINGKIIQPKKITEAQKSKSSIVEKHNAMPFGNSRKQTEEEINRQLQIENQKYYDVNTDNINAYNQTTQNINQGEVPITETPDEEEYFVNQNEMYPSMKEFKYGGARQLKRYADGGEQAQQEQVMQAIAQMLQQMEPEAIVQKLIEQQIPQEQAMQLVQQVMQMMGGQEEQGQEQQMQQDPAQQQMQEQSAPQGQAPEEEQEMQQPQMMFGGTSPKLLYNEFNRGMKMAFGGEANFDTSNSKSYANDQLAYFANYLKQNNGNAIGKEVFMGNNNLPQAAYGMSLMKASGGTDLAKALEAHKLTQAEYDSNPEYKKMVDEYLANRIKFENNASTKTEDKTTTSKETDKTNTTNTNGITVRNGIIYDAQGNALGQAFNNQNQQQFNPYNQPFYGNNPNPIANFFQNGIGRTANYTANIGGVKTPLPSNFDLGAFMQGKNVSSIATLTRGDQGKKLFKNKKVGARIYFGEPGKQAGFLNNSANNQVFSGPGNQGYNADANGNGMPDYLETNNNVNQNSNVQNVASNNVTSNNVTSNNATTNNQKTVNNTPVYDNTLFPPDVSQEEFDAGRPSFFNPSVAASVKPVNNNTVNNNSVYQDPQTATTITSPYGDFYTKGDSELNEKMRAIDAYNREAELQPQFLNPNNYLVDYDNEGNPSNFRMNTGNVNEPVNNTSIVQNNLEREQYSYPLLKTSDNNYFYNNLETNSPVNLNGEMFQGDIKNSNPFYYTDGKSGKKYPVYNNGYDNFIKTEDNKRLIIPKDQLQGTQSINNFKVEGDFDPYSFKYGGQTGYLPMAFWGRDMQKDLGRNNYNDNEYLDVSAQSSIDSGLAADASMYGAQWLTNQFNKIRNSDPQREKAKFDTINQYGPIDFNEGNRGFYDDRGNMMAPNLGNNVQNQTDSYGQNLNRIFADGGAFDLGEDYDLTDEEISLMEAAGYKIKRM